ncbi:MAG: urocanate hydratase [Firmicutes bacterium]|nr:urocanate hydratase [Bacillota bacterium]
MQNKLINNAMRVKITELPPKKPFIEGIRRAPKREFNLSKADTQLALSNALRYIPDEWHDELIPEFLDELYTTGRIYGYRFRPDGRIFARPVDEYKGRTLEGKAFQLMIDNNLDFDVALYPYELVTYGETGQVCANWMQYVLIKKYLEVMKSDETLTVMSGHPLGLFKSGKTAPRVVITNALMVGYFDNMESWHRAAALGVANYGQMTAGGWMYIGPQGIVHGTYNTLLNAARLKFNLQANQKLDNILFVSSGLGGMSGAQSKAVEIAGGVGIIAEVDQSRIKTRFEQSWVGAVSSTPKDAFDLAAKHLQQKKPIGIAFHGNIVDLLEYAVTHNIKIDLLSDQTSCHAVYDGGYCPQNLTFEQRTQMLKTDKNAFKKLVDQSLKAHYEAIKTLAQRGTYFFDYGNSFLKSVFDAGVREVCKNGENELDGFVFPSYVEDILGPICFDYGYGPFRWVCLSGKNEDLDRTDKAAMECIDPTRRFQDADNYNWIKDAKKNGLVVGSKARILYQDAEGRLKIALKFNEMVRNVEVGPIMLGRDHHDTGGTDSPFRETSNIKDVSNIMADMATQVFAGNAARGMSLVALHNGGGTGIGRAINGGFGMVLDGSLRVDKILKTAMVWDVMCGVSRRAWAKNTNSLGVCEEFNDRGAGTVTLPFAADMGKVAKAVENSWACEHK